jgi:hypothetical protein
MRSFFFPSPQTIRPNAVGRVYPPIRNIAVVAALVGKVNCEDGNL